jgi:hypothetical protein
MAGALQKLVPAERVEVVETLGGGRRADAEALGRRADAAELDRPILRVAAPNLV